MGYLKGKSSLMIFDRHANLKYKYGNRKFWCRGYYVDTCGKNAKKIEEEKEKEEKILRDSGVTEDTIEAIRFYDRQAFNSDRRYYERVQETDTYLDTVAASTDQAEPKTVQDFLDYIENQELFHVLIIVDRLKEKVQNDVWIAVFMQLFLVALDKIFFKD